MTLYLVTPSQNHLTVFSNSASTINQELINAIPKIFSQTDDGYKVTEISENLRVMDIGCIKMCARIETIINNLTPADAKSEATMRQVLINSFMFG